MVWTGLRQAIIAELAPARPPPSIQADPTGMDNPAPPAAGSDHNPSPTHGEALPVAHSWQGLTA
ncbi:hypothetical protein SCOCK_690017 [Actinacidiphila cocklensis]|uniref:Uncharacterized protein n=1 Tax=Actinacidiphila cocklensis TaxID=887465 RepID=A0A9W4E374_9ACTN|nr:hypothetical protein SCOCK_690017 [Actinacidiphila cocklensis]